MYLFKPATCRNLREIKDTIQRTEGCPPTEKASSSGILRAQREDGRLAVAKAEAVPATSRQRGGGGSEHAEN